MSRINQVLLYYNKNQANTIKHTTILQVLANVFVTRITRKRQTFSVEQTETV